MRTVTDKIILMLICCFFLLYSGSFYNACLTLLMSIAVIAITAGVSRRTFSIISSLLYLVPVFLTSYPFYAFLPLMCYEVFHTLVSPVSSRIKPDRGLYLSCGYTLLTGILVCTAGIPCTDTGHIFLLILLMIFADFIAVRTILLTATGDALEHQQNVSRGTEILMQKHQEDFKLRQDNEVRLATLKERNRIAREIHDNVGHMLSRALLLTGALETVNKEPSLSEPIGSLRSTLAEAMENVRESVHDLYDESIDLNATIEAIVRDFTFCPVELDIDPGRYMARDTKYCIISILKEALSNTAKHSNADRVRVTLRTHTGGYQLLIEDNGTVSLNSDGTGIGLESMRERVAALRGTIYISSEKGYRIFVTLPSGA